MKVDEKLLDKYIDENFSNCKPLTKEGRKAVSETFDFAVFLLKCCVQRVCGGNQERVSEDIRGGNMMKTVWIVCSGEDCEGGFIHAVFAKELDAITYLIENFSEYREVSLHERRSFYESDGKLYDGCRSAWVGEWEVE